MKTKDLLAITTVALGTAALTVVTFWSGPIDAGIEAEGPTTKITHPKLKCNEVEFSVAHRGLWAIKAGDRPEFQLTAINTTKQPRTAKVEIIMSASPPVSALSRTIAMPRVLWRREQEVTLNPDETRVIPLSVGTNTPANSNVSIRLADMSPSVAQVTKAPGEIPFKSAVQPLRNEIVAFTFSTVTNTEPLLSLTLGPSPNNSSRP